MSGGDATRARRRGPGWLRRLRRPAGPLPWRPRTRPQAGALALGLLGLLWVTSAGDAYAGTPSWHRRALLDAIRWVESRDRPDSEVPDGDDGLAIGPYQIHEVYWRDARAFDASLGGSYQDCRDRRYAERVIDAYMRRHAAKAWAMGDGERVARVHNGGPLGHRKRATLGYWRQVRNRLPSPR